MKLRGGPKKWTKLKILAEGEEAEGEGVSGGVLGQRLDCRGYSRAGNNTEGMFPVRANSQTVFPVMSWFC